MTITVKDLANQTLLPFDDIRRQEVIFCPSCCAQYSANKADYWWCLDSQELICEHCGEPFVLAREETRLVIVKE